MFFALKLKANARIFKAKDSVMNFLHKNKPTFNEWEHVQDFEIF